MSATTDKIKGYANEAVGKVKQVTGKILDDDALKAEGVAQEAKGDLQKAVGAGKENLKKVVDNL